MKNKINKQQIICLGVVAWDYIAISHHKIKLGQDLPGKITKRFGGVALNIAAALDRTAEEKNFAVKIFLASVIGEDITLNQMQNIFNIGNIDLRYMHTASGRSDTYLAIESKNKLFGINTRQKVEKKDPE